MKKTILCFITGSGIGGVATAFTSFAHALEEKGYNVKVLLLYEKEIAETSIPSKYVCGSAFKWPITNKVIRFIAQIINLITHRYFYFKLAKKVDHDIFIAYQGMGCSHWYQYTKKPSVIFFHQRLPFNPSGGIITSLLRNLHSYNFQRFTERVAISDVIAKSWQARYRFKNLPQTILNLVNVKNVLELSLESQCEMTKSGRPQLISVARLSFEKGILRLLEVAKRVLLEGGSFDLYLVGDGPLMGDVLKFVKANSLEDTIHILGKKKNPYPYMKAADLLVLPSYEEGLGLVLWESLIVNTPVLATRCGGAEEALRGGEWGTLVENSEDGLYKGIEYAINNLDTLTQSVDSNNIREELENMNVEMCNRLMNLLYNLIK